MPKDLSLDRRNAVSTRADGLIDQNWAAYTPEEHNRWNRLAGRMAETLLPRACPEFLEAMAQLDLGSGGVPDMAALSRRLRPMTGWEVVPVAGLVADDVFFDHLANRRFPAGAFLRSEAEFDYLEEPDIFHDIYGHVPLLANPVYAAFMEAYGKGGQRAMALGQLKNLARLYWYTIEFGLIRGQGGLKLFGAGIMSSQAESHYALESGAPHRVAFDLERIMRTDYGIDDFQKIYFVIDSFEDLLAACEVDFAALYERLAEAEDIPAGALVPEDKIVTA